MTLHGAIFFPSVWSIRPIKLARNKLWQIWNMNTVEKTVLYILMISVYLCGVSTNKFTQLKLSLSSGILEPTYNLCHALASPRCYITFEIHYGHNFANLFVFFSSNRCIQLVIWTKRIKRCVRIFCWFDDLVTLRRC